MPVPFYALFDRLMQGCVALRRNKLSHEYSGR